MRSSWKLTWTLVVLSAGCSTPGFPGAKKQAQPNNFGASGPPVAQTSWTEKIDSALHFQGLEETQGNRFQE